VNPRIECPDEAVNPGIPACAGIAATGGGAIIVADTLEAEAAKGSLFDIIAVSGSILSIRAIIDNDELFVASTSST
jgi:hypothetical protein